MSNGFDRRDFLKQATVAGLSLSLVSQMASGQDAQPGAKKKGGKRNGKKGKGPAIITKKVDNVPASERIRVAVVGCNGRGGAHIACLSQIPGVDITHICDVDSRAMAKGIKAVAARGAKEPMGIKDVRKLLEDKNVDAITIATPDHWHAPLTIMALAAGKNVYCEKPATHNPYEGELLVKAIDKYKKIYQMGNQRRSYPNVQQAVEQIHSGKLIGNAYLARAWYAMGRKGIGIGKEIPIPEWLGADGYDLWQGPAPRRAYKDNFLHYMWHWRWIWGTGEALNNGTHEVDVCRWALGVTKPTRVASTGGRYFITGQDDWETPDTQIINWDFPEGKGMTWEGRSCSQFKNEGLDRGSLIYGTEGSCLIDGDSYTVYDKKGAVVKKVQGRPLDATNTVSTDIKGDALHFFNFIETIRGKAKANSPVTEGPVSCQLLHLGNIAWRTNSQLQIDTETGLIKGNDEAMKLWKREYEKGWEPMQYV